TAEGTDRTAVFPSLTHRVPSSPRASGAGYFLHPRGRSFGSSSDIGMSFGSSAAIATRSAGAAAAGRLTKYSSTASESVADVYTTAVPRRFQRPPARRDP